MSEKISIQKWVLWLFAGITPASAIITMMSTSYSIGVWQRDLESRIFPSTEVRNTVISRAMDNELHSSYKQNAIDFVPRSEVEYRLGVLQMNVDEMKVDVKGILKALNVNN